MISIKEIYDHTVALSGAQSTAYSSAAEFNLDSKKAESLLFEYRLLSYDGGRSSDVMDRFKKTKKVSAGTGVVPVPVDFRSFIEFAAYEVASGKENIHIAHYLQGHTVAATLSSPIRGGKKNCRYNVYRNGDNFIVSPGPTYLSIAYFRNPVFAVYGYTTDGANWVENFDVNASTNYEWGEQDRGDLINILLYLRGLKINSPELINFLNNKIVQQNG